jgi:hypothetical protein
LISGIQVRPKASAWFDPSSFWPSATGIEGNSSATSVVVYFHHVTQLFTKFARATGSEKIGF